MKIWIFAYKCRTVFEEFLAYHSIYSLSLPTSWHCVLQSIHSHNFSTHVAIQLATRQVSLARPGRQAGSAWPNEIVGIGRGEESREEQSISMRPKDSPKSFQIVEWSKTHCDNWQYSLGRWSITRAANTCSSSTDETRGEACAESLLIGSATSTVVNEERGRGRGRSDQHRRCVAQLRAAN